METAAAAPVVAALAVFSVRRRFRDPVRAVLRGRSARIGGARQRLRAEIDPIRNADVERDPDRGCADELQER